MVVLNFIINEIFGQGAIFLALIAMIPSILQKKQFERDCPGNHDDGNRILCAVTRYRDYYRGFIDRPGGGI